MTFSLVGRCARTGQIGAAVTTSSMGVGARCPHARAGVGAVLTQHRTDPRLGPLGLDLMAQGFTAEQALKAIVAATPHHAWRQLALIDAKGGVATFSGARVNPEKGEAHGRNCAAIGNIVRSAEVPFAMVKAFEANPDAPLSRRLVDGLIAGEAAGGELQPVTSAALSVAWKESFLYVDIRVDDHPQVLKELDRLWRKYEPEVDAYVVRAVDPDNATRPPGSLPIPGVT